MLKRKTRSERGKLKLSEYFKELKKGDKITIVREHAQNASFPKRMQGRSGFVEGKRGKAYVVKIKDYDQEKTYIIKPIHLKKLKQ